MSRGKSTEELKQTVFNIAKLKGIDPEQVAGMLSQFGIKI